MIGAIVTLVPAMFIGEVALAFARHQYADHLLGEVPKIFRPDPKLVYAPVPGARGRHASIGNFDVEYEIDEQGRKAVPQNQDARRSVHVFGDFVHLRLWRRQCRHLAQPAERASSGTRSTS